MSAVTEAVKTYLIPGSLPFLLLGLTVGLFLLYLREPAARWGRRWLTVVAIVYWTLGMPVTASLLLEGLTGNLTPIETVHEATGADAIVVLTGGVATYRHGGSLIRMLPAPTALRTLEARRLYALLGEPWLVVSGGNPGADGTTEAEAVRQELIRLGVRDDRILVEARSRNTREHALFLPPLLEQKEIDRFVLVTSPTEMRRQQAALEAAGLAPIPSITLEAGAGNGEWGFAPSAAALSQSRVAMLGYLGLVYYWWNGWLG